MNLHRNEIEQSIRGDAGVVRHRLLNHITSLELWVNDHDDKDSQEYVENTAAAYRKIVEALTPQSKTRNAIEAEISAVGLDSVTQGYSELLALVTANPTFDETTARQIVNLGSQIRTALDQLPSKVADEEAIEQMRAEARKARQAR